MGETILSTEWLPSLDYFAGLGFHLNGKTRLYAGLGYSRQSVLTEYDLHIPYNLQTEIDHGALLTNAFAHSLPTSAGNVGSNLVLERSAGTDVVHNEEIDIRLGATSRYHIWNLPVSIERRFSPANRLSPGLGFTAQLSFLVHDKVVSNHVDVDHTLVRLHSLDLLADQNNKTQFVFSYGANPFLSFRMNGRSFLQLGLPATLWHLSERTHLSLRPQVRWSIKIK